jgi:hypothetical protein
MPTKPFLLVDGLRGIYVAQHFAKTIDRSLVTNVSEEDWRIMEAGPESEHYSDVWLLTQLHAVIDGGSLHQTEDGDLFWLPTGWLVAQDGSFVSSKEANCVDEKS